MKGLSGLIDLHCHILPGADDGVEEMEESLTCLRAAHEAGFDTLVLSRHQMTGVYDLPLETARRRRIDLEKALAEAGIPLTLHDGAEHYLDENFLDNLAGGMETLAGGRALLLELSLTRMPPILSEIAFRIRIKGLAPILAHVERYREVIDKPKFTEELVDMGFLLQVNLGSLSGFYGRKVALAARYILERGLAFCVAGDIHGTRWLAPAYVTGIKELMKAHGEKALHVLLRDNPRKVIEGMAL